MKRTFFMLVTSVVVTAPVSATDTIYPGAHYPNYAGPDTGSTFRPMDGYSQGRGGSSGSASGHPSFTDYGNRGGDWGGGGSTYRPLKPPESRSTYPEAREPAYRARSYGMPGGYGGISQYPALMDPLYRPGSEVLSMPPTYGDQGWGTSPGTVYPELLTFPGDLYSREGRGSQEYDYGRQDYPGQDYGRQSYPDRRSSQRPDHSRQQEYYRASPEESRRYAPEPDYPGSELSPPRYRSDTMQRDYSRREPPVDGAYPQSASPSLMGDMAPRGELRGEDSNQQDWWAEQTRKQDRQSRMPEQYGRGDDLPYAPGGLDDSRVRSAARRSTGSDGYGTDSGGSQFRPWSAEEQVEMGVGRDARLPPRAPGFDSEVADDSGYRPYPDEPELPPVVREWQRDMAAQDAPPGVADEQENKDRLDKRLRESARAFELRMSKQFGSLDREPASAAEQKSPSLADTMGGFGQSRPAAQPAMPPAASSRPPSLAEPMPAVAPPAFRQWPGEAGMLGQPWSIPVTPVVSPLQDWAATSAKPTAAVDEVPTANPEASPQAPLVEAPLSDATPASVVEPAAEPEASAEASAEAEAVAEPVQPVSEPAGLVPDQPEAMSSEAGPADSVVDAESEPASHQLRPVTVPVTGPVPVPDSTPALAPVDLPPATEPVEADVIPATGYGRPAPLEPADSDAAEAELETINEAVPEQMQPPLPGLSRETELAPQLPPLVGSSQELAETDQRSTPFVVPLTGDAE